MSQPPTQYRILFTATARFANGGSIELNDFMFDWPDDRLDAAQLERLIVRSLNLLMVHEIEFHQVEIVAREHKGLPGRQRPTAVGERRLLGSEPVDRVDVPADRLLPAAFLQLAGHQPGEVSALTCYGAWNGEPVVVIAGLGAAHITEKTVQELHDGGLAWIVSDTAVASSIVPVTVAPRLVAALTGDLLEIGLISGGRDEHRLVATLIAEPNEERGSRP